MNILRNELKYNFSQIPNELITDLNLCNGSLRVILYLFTKPDDWKVYNLDICKNLNISEQTLTKYWKKLLASGWISREPSRNDEGKLTGGYTYRIGKFTVSIQSTESVKSIDYSNNKLINKQESNKEISTKYTKQNSFTLFLNTLESKVKYKTKVTRTKEGENLFKQIDDKEKLSDDYISHQLEKKEFAVRITAFMKDYETVHKENYQPKENEIVIDGQVWTSEVY